VSALGSVESVGATAERWLAYVGGLVQLVSPSLKRAVVSPLKARRATQRAIRQGMAVGIEAIPIVSLVTFFIGVIMALQGAYELRRLGAALSAKHRWRPV
jgi:phospholipid/cholesterol/gamma-HCH transport system permease protein